MDSEQRKGISNGKYPAQRQVSTAKQTANHETKATRPPHTQIGQIPITNKILLSAEPATVANIRTFPGPLGDVSAVAGATSRR